ncbi:FAD-dependent oxidoreductase, partial [Staphylococcus aureus]|nr:FAD-dependent oxidoreductase [Staphylococcus aureus]
MSEKQYDLVVLGGGTAGYVAAIRASQLGKKVAIVERQLLGGTCLHKGCIPTKSLLKSAEVFQTVKQAAMFGVDVKDANVNFENMLARKEDIINQMYQGVKHLMQHNHIDIYNGTGRILGTSIFSPQSGTISVEYEDGESDLLPNQFVLIATGSSPAELPFLSFDHDKILSSDDILSLKTLPSSIGIIGGGVIGMEFASLMIDLGVDVTVIEAGERILPTESKQASQLLKKSLSARGVKFYEGIKLSENDINVN